ncbi:hypothetical protein [Streptomyces alboflavus]|uniref:hypothetical protein n=1 Tax=Streptomyces alboflavus TaxID=67267 RepID=UPI000F657254|nr:hypothetical protein [Streptomyces alboflavus]
MGVTGVADSGATESAADCEASTASKAAGKKEALEIEIDAWVEKNLVLSPEWGEDKWTVLGEILDVEFSRVAP